MSTSVIFPPPGDEVMCTYEEPAPAAITLVWPQGPRTGVIHLEHQPGWSVRNYLRHPALKGYPLRSLWLRCRCLNGKKQRIKLHYVPPPGDTIVLIRVR